MIKHCKVCGKVIPEARLKILPGTVTCVEHSETGKKVGVPINLGSGEDTYTELNIMNEDEALRFERLKRRYNE
jgi:hypothetical protein